MGICNLCGKQIGKVFKLLACSKGAVCWNCAAGRTKEVLELEAQMAEEFQQEMDALE